MIVHTVLFSEVRKIVGSKEITIELKENATVEDALELLCYKYGQSFKNAVIDEEKSHYKVNFSVNSNMTFANQVLEEGDTLKIFPVAGGG